MINWFTSTVGHFLAIVFINVNDIMLVLQCMRNAPCTSLTAEQCMRPAWLVVPVLVSHMDQHIEVQSRSTAVISSTVVAVSPADTLGSLLNDKVSIPANDIHSNHVIHIYNFILATQAIIITIFTCEPINQVAVA